MNILNRGEDKRITFLITDDAGTSILWSDIATLTIDVKVNEVLQKQFTKAAPTITLVSGSTTQFYIDLSKTDTANYPEGVISATLTYGLTSTGKTYVENTGIIFKIV